MSGAALRERNGLSTAPRLRVSSLGRSSADNHQWAVGGVKQSSAGRSEKERRESSAPTTADDNNPRMTGQLDELVHRTVTNDDLVHIHVTVRLAPSSQSFGEHRLFHSGHLGPTWIIIRIGGEDRREIDVAPRMRGDQTGVPSSPELVRHQSLPTLGIPVRAKGH